MTSASEVAGLTSREIRAAAREQSAIDLGCREEDFLGEEPVIVLSRPDPRARKYLELPFTCALVCYGSNVVASVQPEYHDLTADYLRRFPPEHCFETPNLHVLDEALAPLGQKVCFMAEYFLPLPEAVRPLRCPYELRLLGPEDFAGLYLPEWSNALCEKRRELDVLGVGAYDGERLVGLAGCSADCDTMRQIGVDVLPEYRRQGIAGALTSRLTLEILERGKIPFYCAAWSNLPSVRSALKSGFRPAWVELTAKSIDYVDGMNRPDK